jgi:hypothetical protein
MQQHHGRTLATNSHMHCRAFDFDVLSVEGGGEGGNVGVDLETQGEQGEASQQWAGHGEVSRRGGDGESVDVSIRGGGVSSASKRRLDKCPQRLLFENFDREMPEALGQPDDAGSGGESMGWA